MKREQLTSILKSLRESSSTSGENLACRTTSIEEKLKNLDSTVIAELTSSSISGDVESADIEICASGFDNLVLDDGLEELESLQKSLKLIGAPKCELVISGFIQWLRSDLDKGPPELLDSKPEKVNEFWRAYDEASCAENPRELATEYESRRV